jgi:hypothetical protein
VKLPKGSSADKKAFKMEAETTLKCSYPELRHKNIVLALAMTDTQLVLGRQRLEREK